MFFSLNSQILLIALPLTAFSATVPSAYRNATTTKPDTSTITSTSFACAAQAATPTWCRVSVGTMQISYWPTGAATRNHTYPKTIFVPEYNITMTSPLVYWFINTMKATDLCNNYVGTPLTNYVTSYNLTDVSTIFKGVHTTVATQLNLGDLKANCRPLNVTGMSYEDQVHAKLDSGCYPLIYWPLGLKLAESAWRSCGRHDGGPGILDPPMPVTACSNDDVDCLYQGASPMTSSSMEQVTALPEHVVSTTSAEPGPAVTAPGPEATGPITTTSPAASNAEPAVQTTVPMPTPAAKDDPATSSSPVAAEVQTTPSPIVIVVGTNTISAAGSSGIVLPNGFTVSAGSVVTLTDAQNSQVVVSVGNSNVVVGTSTYALSTAAATGSGSLAPQVNIVLNGQTISGVTVASSAAVIGGQTLSVGGSAVTLSGNQVATLGPNGLVIQAPGGVVTTISASVVAAVTATASPSSLSSSSSISVISKSLTTAVTTGIASAIKLVVTSSSSSSLKNATLSKTATASPSRVTTNGGPESRNIDGNVWSWTFSFLLGALYVF